MSTGRPENMAASARARLTELARKQGEDFQLVLTRYAIERLLYRLTRAAHAAEFVLKGGCCSGCGPTSCTARPATSTCSAAAARRSTGWRRCSGSGSRRGPWAKERPV